MRYKVTRKGGEKVIGWVCLFIMMIFPLMHLILIIAGESLGIAFDIIFSLFYATFIGLGAFLIYRGSRPKVIVEGNGMKYYPPFEKPICISMSDICGRRISKSETDTMVAMAAGGAAGGLIGVLISLGISAAAGKKKMPLYISYKTRDGKIISIDSRMKNADLLDQSIIQHLKMIGEPENVADFSTPAEDCLNERFEDYIIEEKFNDKVEAERYIKKQYKTKAKTRIIQVVFFCVFAACVFMAFFCHPDETSNAIQFNRNETEIKEECCYIDIIAISDWLLKNDEETYYMAVNSVGEYTIVRLHDDSYEKLTLQRDYFNGVTNSVPEPCRVYGTGHIISNELNQEFSEIIGLSDEELLLLCGTSYFDDTTPYEEQSTIFGGVSFFLGLFVIIILYAIIHRQVTINKSIKRLKNDNSIIVAANEAYSVKGLWKKKKENVVITKTYFFSSMGYIIPVSEILWCYVKTANAGKKGNDSILISTVKMKEKVVASYSINSGEAYVVQKNIAKRNPEALIGYSVENKIKFEEMRKQA